MSKAGGFFASMNSVSGVILAIFLYASLWKSEAIYILKQQKAETQPEDVDRVEKNMLDRFSFSSIYGLFEAAKELNERSVSLD